jgi:plastocyanin
MANTIIQLKHSTVTGNVPSSLANGEISINSRDGKLFYSTPLGVVTAFNPYPGPAGLDTEIQFNDSGSLGGSEKLTFNKTTGLLTVNGTVRANIFSDDGVDIFNFANNAFNTANANYTSAVTKINVTHSGTSAYLLDQYSGNNPTVYVRAGETIAFNLNVLGHPFMIRVSSGGANYDTGLTHVATDGTVTTGSSAQGKIAGTLYWKVPTDISGGYRYQCSLHAPMVGSISIKTFSTL